ncbi:MAG: ABC transporter ATP-binding protein [Candidatus Bathyarchaeia archaeon]
MNQPAKSNTPVIETVELKKVYRIGRVLVNALRGVNLRIDRGEFVSIVGPSGCGKSTLLNMIGALDKPTSGKIIIDGFNIATYSDEKLARFRNRKIGFIFQSYHLISRTSVLRNVELPAVVKGLPGRVRRRKALELLELVGLSRKEGRKPVEMSGGEQQRVAIARALINDPSIILADEPTGNLDSKTGAEIEQLLKKINREKRATIIMVTHNLELAEDTDRIIYLRDGVVEKVTEGIAV